MEHIRELTIHSYKGIENLQLKDLNHINLLTGNNNCGKTSILELLSAVGNERDFSAWFLGTRYTVSSSEHSCYQGISMLFPIDQENKQLAFDYRLSDDSSFRVTLDGIENSISVPEQQVNNVPYRTLDLAFNEQYGSPIVLPFALSAEYEDSEEPPEMLDVGMLTLRLCINEERIGQLTLYDLNRRAVWMGMVLPQTPVYIPPSARGNQRQLRYLNRVLTSSSLYSKLIRLLQSFDSSIIGLQAVAPRQRKLYSSPEYVVLSTDHEEALPLRAYGDGMQKAVLLMSAILYAKGGLLLLDEFETGIHTSCMDTVFQMVLECAVENDVQVFMTSHSKEAISKVLRLSERIREATNVYTLYRYEGSHYVRRMSAEEAVSAQEKMGLELR